MGKLSRTKGRAFEQDIARRLRARWPHLTVRRSQQGDKAYEPDVVVEGVPLWLECQCAAKPTSLVKLAQAERDVERFTETMLPVVVWRKSGERTTWATMRLGTLLKSFAPESHHRVGLGVVQDDTVVTLDLDEWLQCVEIQETRPTRTVHNYRCPALPSVDGGKDGRPYGACNCAAKEAT